MCGIVYAHSLEGRAVNNGILNQYDGQKHRGKEGFGVFDGVNKHIVHAAEEDRILNWLCKDRNQSSLLLMHHRFPTSTINVRRAAHPFSTKAFFGKNQYILVHNGSIRNDEELFKDHQAEGIDYHSLLPDLTFNDSEALLWDFALTIEGKQPKMKAYGQIAFICLKLVNGELSKMYFGRNTNPLNLLRIKEGIALSSEGEGEPIESDTLYTYNYDLNRLTTRRFKFHQFDPEFDTYNNDTDWRNNYPNWYNDEDTINREETENYELYNEEDIKVAEREKLHPDEIVRTAREYLNMVNGYFEQAVWAIESDLDDLYVRYESPETIVETRLLEAVLDFIESDPDNISINSKSSYWESEYQT